MNAPTLPEAVAARVRAAVEADPRTPKQIAAATWPDNHAAARRLLSRLLAGESLTLDNIDDLARGLQRSPDALLCSTELGAALAERDDARLEAAWRRCRMRNSGTMRLHFAEMYGVEACEAIAWPDTATGETPALASFAKLG